MKSEINVTVQCARLNLQEVGNYRKKAEGKLKKIKKVFFLNSLHSSAVKIMV
jgi:hypothetical protein